MSPLSRSGALCQASSSRQRTVPSAIAGVGDGVGHGARADPAPDQAEAGPGVDPPGQGRGHLGDDLAEGVDQVRGQVRPGGVTAGPGHAHLDPVAGGGDRAGAHAELARVQPGIAVQGEDPADRGDAARREHVQSAAGRLLGGLEDQPHPPGQQAGGGQVGQVQAGAHQQGGVHVVTAGVADVRHGGAIGDVLLVRHGQRVQVGAQGHHGPVALGLRLGADVHEQARALGQDHRPQAHRGQPQRDPAGGAVLGVGQLGMRVQVAAELDQLVFVSGQEHVQIREQIIAFHAQPLPCVQNLSSANSVTSASTTLIRSPVRA